MNHVSYLIRMISQNILSSYILFLLLCLCKCYYLILVDTNELECGCGCRGRRYRNYTMKQLMYVLCLVRFVSSCRWFCVDKIGSFLSFVCDDVVLYHYSFTRNHRLLPFLEIESWGAALKKYSSSYLASGFPIVGERHPLSALFNFIRELANAWQ